MEHVVTNRWEVTFFVVFRGFRLDECVGTQIMNYRCEFATVDAGIDTYAPHSDFGHIALVVTQGKRRAYPQVYRMRFG